MLETVWFVILGMMLIGYAVLDGFDLGVGALHLCLGRSRDERTRLVDAIGPVWNGNEVWLLAAGGSMIVAFPTLYAASFSGFYLALMLVLWLLVLRGLALEFRHQIPHPLWRDAWDVVFSLSSTLLAVLFGVAVGNVLRGVPLDESGHFQGSFALMLNPFAILGGLLALVVLAHHGAAWLVLKTHAELRDRARRWQRTLAGFTTVAVGALVAASFVVRPQFTTNFKAAPLLLVVPALGIFCLVAERFLIGRNDQRAFLASAGLIASLLGSAAAGLYPRLLPASPGSPHGGLDIYNTAAPEGSLKIALGIYLFGMALVSIYLRRMYRIWRGKVSAY
jgi:cytochrome bd ubiquinol oxidase subunit II